MILPTRALRVDPAFVRYSWLRVLGFLAPGLALFLVVGLWQGRAAYELVLDQAAWRTGEPVAVTSVETDVAVVAALARHVRIRAAYVAGDGEQRTVRDDYWTLLTDPVGDGPLEGRQDASSGRVALSWSMEAARWRWGWILFFGLVFAGLGLLLCGVAWRALRTLRVARAAASQGEEVELEVIELRREDFGGLDITYQAPPLTSQAPLGYRDAAATLTAVRTEHFDVSDRAPILLDGETRLFAVRPKHRPSDVILLADGFWPFALSSDEREQAAARIEERRSIESRPSV